MKGPIVVLGFFLLIYGLAHLIVWRPRNIKKDSK